jgi:hypothetical protein
MIALSPLKVKAQHVEWAREQGSVWRLTATKPHDELSPGRKQGERWLTTHATGSHSIVGKTSPQLRLRRCVGTSPQRLRSALLAQRPGSVALSL